MQWNVCAILGALHISAYLLARFGNLLQVQKIRRKKKLVNASAQFNDSTWTRQISTMYRIATPLVFLTITLWSASLEQVDWVIFSTRVFAFACFTYVLWELWRDRKRLTTLLSLIALLLLAVATVVLIVFSLDWLTQHHRILEYATVFCILPMVLGILHKSWLIYDAKSVGEQDGGEICGQLFKDLTGILYGAVCELSQNWPFVCLLVATLVSRLVNAWIFWIYRDKGIREERF